MDIILFRQYRLPCPVGSLIVYTIADQSPACKRTGIAVGSEKRDWSDKMSYRSELR